MVAIFLPLEPCCLRSFLCDTVLMMSFKAVRASSLAEKSRNRRGLLVYLKNDTKLSFVSFGVSRKEEIIEMTTLLSENAVCPRDVWDSGVTVSLFPEEKFCLYCVPRSTRAISEMVGVVGSGRSNFYRAQLELCRVSRQKM